MVAIIPLGSFSAYASDPQPIRWSDLVPDNTFPDPFKKLSPKQLDDLGFVVRIRHLLAAEKVTADGPEVKEAAKIEQSLIKAGIDIGWLVAQRRRVGQLREMQAKAVQRDVVGKRVKLAGYVIPVKVSDDLVTEFLLVPDIPACSQSTPPPPNQMVYVHARDGISVEGRITAVSIKGRIEARETKSILLRVSGPVTFDGAYAISPEEIEVHSIREDNVLSAVTERAK
jgi:hypothetical protein